jgi:hypothetical protein
MVGRRRLLDGLANKRERGKCILCDRNHCMRGEKYGWGDPFPFCEVCYGWVLWRRGELRRKRERGEGKRGGVLQTKREFWEARQRLVGLRLRRAELRRMREVGDGRDGSE